MLALADQIRRRSGSLRLGTRVGPAVLTPHEKREEAWSRLATDLDLAKLNSMTSRARLDDVPSLAIEILAGKTRGRVVIDL